MNFFGKRLNNRGVSLVELIVVITIMTILVGSAGVGIGVISGKPAQQAANKWASEMERIRTVGMGKKTASSTLIMDSSGWCIYETIEGKEYSKTKIAASSVSCDVVVGGTSFPVNKDTEVEVVFARNDGSLKSVSIGESPVYELSTITDEVVFTFKKYHTTYNVVVTPITGRVVVKKL